MENNIEYRAIWVNSLLQRLHALAFIEEEQGGFKWYPISDISTSEVFPVYILLIQHQSLFKFYDAYNFDVLTEDEMYNLIYHIIVKYSKNVRAHESKEVIDFFKKRFSKLANYLALNPFPEIRQASSL